MISKNAIFASIGVSLAVSILSIATQNPKEFENSRLGIFIKILSSLAFILVAMGLVLTAQSIEEGQKLTKIDQTFKLIDRAFLEPVAKMTELSPRCPTFVKSLWPQIHDLSTTSKEDMEKEDSIAIVDLSIVMLQCMEDHFTGTQFDTTGEMIWAGNFLQWGSSNKFHDTWKALYPNFKKSTNEYAKLIFEYATKNGKIRNSDDLNERAFEFSRDERVRELYEEHKRNR